MPDVLNFKRLLVEGKDEQRVLPFLMEANGIGWPKERPPIEIKDLDGYEKIANTARILTHLKSGITHLGIIVDADDSIVSRWESLRNACLPAISDLPPDLPISGLIHPVSNEAISQKTIKFGIWIMPDNRIRGMLETFLAYLIPDQSEPLWGFAQSATQQAKEIGAPFTEAKSDKAKIYTWLAWQKSPGRQLHDAVKQKILDPEHQAAHTFVTWFKTLYDL